MLCRQGGDSAAGRDKSNMLFATDDETSLVGGPLSADWRGDYVSLSAPGSSQSLLACTLPLPLHPRKYEIPVRALSLKTKIFDSFIFFRQTFVIFFGWSSDAKNWRAIYFSNGVFSWQTSWRTVGVSYIFERCFSWQTFSGDGVALGCPNRSRWETRHS